MNDVANLQLFLAEVLEQLSPYTVSFNIGSSSDPEGWVAFALELKGQDARDMRVRTAGDYRGRPMVELDDDKPFPALLIEANAVAVAHWLRRWRYPRSA